MINPLSGMRSAPHGGSKDACHISWSRLVHVLAGADSGWPRTEARALVEPEAFGMQERASPSRVVILSLLLQGARTQRLDLATGNMHDSVASPLTFSTTSTSSPAFANLAAVATPPIPAPDKSL